MENVFKRVIETDNLFKCQLDFALKENSRRDFLRYSSPSFAFAYLTKQGPLSSYGRRIDLTYQEEDSPDFRFWKDVQNSLNEEGNNILLKLQLLLYSNPKQISTEQEKIFFYVSSGLSKHYFKKEYNDIVQAMYYMDKIANNILTTGIKNNKKPVWSRFSYNFQNIKELNDPSFFNTKFEDYLGSLGNSLTAMIVPTSS